MRGSQAKNKIMIRIEVREVVGKMNLKRDWTCKHIQAYFLNIRKLHPFFSVVKFFLPKITWLLSAQAMTSTSGDTRNSRDATPIPENSFVSRKSDTRLIGNFGFLLNIFPLLQPCDIIISNRILKGGAVHENPWLKKWKKNSWAFLVDDPGIASHIFFCSKSKDLLEFRKNRQPRNARGYQRKV